jgi:hypothetical protein
MILTVLFAIIGFVSFLFVGVFVMGSIWPELPYETALPYLLGIAIFGAVLFGGFARRKSRKRLHK